MIRLLGPPRIERDGQLVAGPAWPQGVATPCVSSVGRGAPTRLRLAELFFSDADDPLGSLRWNLAEVRHVLGQPGAFCGDPVELALERGTEVDLQLVLSRVLPEAYVAERLAGERLEGVSFACQPRARRVARRGTSSHGRAPSRHSLHGRAQIELGAGRPNVAARLAQRLVETNPFEEDYRELLVCSLVAAAIDQRPWPA